MKPRPAVLASLLLLASASPALAEPTVYRALRDARPDGRQIAVSSVEIRRDVLTFRLSSGTLHFLAPVEGRTFGAVFLGRGSLELAPATESERQHLALRTGDAQMQKLTADFDEVLFLFADGTADELLANGEVRQGTAEPRATAFANDALERLRKQFRPNLHLRLFRGFQDGTGAARGPFFAIFNAKRLPPALAGVDPAGFFGAEETFFFVRHPEQGGYWYSSHLAEEVLSQPAAACRASRVADGLHYVLDSRILRSEDLEGTATIRFRSLVDGTRVLPIDLTDTLRISGAVRIVEDGAGRRETPLDWVQEKKDEDSAAALVFDEPLAFDEEVVVRVRYAGDEVLEDSGDGNFRVGARTSWYPNLSSSLDDPATFDLTYRVPAKRDVVSVGQLVSRRDTPAEAVSVWKVETPVRVAGFNYGTFELLEKKEPTTGVTIRVYTNPGTPDAITEINEALQSATSLSPDQQVGIATAEGNYAGERRTGPTGITIDSRVLADGAMVDCVNSLQVYTRYFGPMAWESIAVTQQSEWFYGQAWPGLVFLPYLAALGATTRAQLDLEGYAGFLDQIAIHEVAHQWWGHRVGWASYRDQWISEGFAEFSTALVLELTHGPGAYDRFWEDWRIRIVGKTRGASIPTYQAGPLTLGDRLSTPAAPSAWDVLGYGKGAYVLQMLRFLMRGEGTEPDERFFAMLRDLVVTFDGKNPSSEDLESFIETRHMIPELNATRDGKLDWFFDQWVHGTRLPRYPAKFEIETMGGGKYRIAGTVAQEGVPDDFLTILPLYLEFGHGDYRMFARSPFKGNMSRPVELVLDLPEKPRRVVPNARHEVLALD